MLGCQAASAKATLPRFFVAPDLSFRIVLRARLVTQLQRERIDFITPQTDVLQDPVIELVQAIGHIALVYHELDD